MGLRCFVLLALAVATLRVQGQDALAAETAESPLEQCQAMLRAWEAAYQSLQASHEQQHTKDASEALNASLKTDLVVAEARTASLQSDLAAAEARAAELQSDLSTSVAQSDSLKQVLAGLESDLAAARAEALQYRELYIEAKAQSEETSPGSFCSSTVVPFVDRVANLLLSVVDKLKAGDIEELARLGSQAFQNATQSVTELVTAQLNLTVLEQLSKDVVRHVDSLRQGFGTLQAELQGAVSHVFSSTPALKDLNDPIVLQLVAYALLSLPVLLLLTLLSLSCRSRKTQTHQQAQRRTRH